MAGKGAQPRKQDPAFGKPQHASKEEPQEVADGAPSSKSPRITRGATTGKNMSYDMKYHPMDDVLRPRQSAARKAINGLIARSPPSSDSTLPVIESDNTESPGSTTSSSSKLASVTRMSPPPRPIRPTAGSPSNRRMTRESNREKPIAYNMKHHPMDAFLRPAETRKRMAKWAAVPNGSHLSTHPKESHVTASNETKDTNHAGSEEEQGPPLLSATDEQPFIASPSTLAGCSSEVPLTTNSAAGCHFPVNSHEAAGWRSLENDDRMLYVLQKGASLGSQTLPLDWFEVAQALRTEPGLPGDSAEAITEIEAFKERYMIIHRGIEAYFNAEPVPVESKTLTRYYAEDFGVYDLERGDKYWKHSKDSIVRSENPLAVNSIPRLQIHVMQDRTPQKAAVDRSDSITVLGDDLLNNALSKVRQEGTTYVRKTAGHAEAMDQAGDEISSTMQRRAADDSDTTDEDEGRGLVGSYNDAEGYIRQVTGPSNNSQGSSIGEGPESEIIAHMRNELSSDINDLLKPDELDPMFHSSADNSGDTMMSEEDCGRATTVDGENESDEEQKVRLAFNRRSKKRKLGNREFSVHEDQPGNTPKIKRQIALNPKSPGTDIPKENLRERSPSDEA
ncbi:MAG: hypothetical protein Q9181_004174 [Wetmoreana brouardii]